MFSGHCFNFKNRGGGGGGGECFTPTEIIGFPPHFAIIGSQSNIMTSMNDKYISSFLTICHHTCRFAKWLKIP